VDELAQTGKNRAKPPVTAKKRLAEQTRKILGKHYASDAGEIPLMSRGEIQTGEHRT
jgi:hypothetical protein